MQSHTSPSLDSQNSKSGFVDSVPLLDVQRENSSLESEILSAITQVCRSGMFVLGPECQQLEERIAELCGVPHAIGCASGSDALILALMGIGIEPDDEVIVPSFTFFATASAVWLTGARPVFVDIDPATFNIPAELIEAAITDKTKAIIPVHLFGQTADMDAINDVAARHGLQVIEDAAQAIGATYRGRTAGALGSVGCFSFYPTKNLGGFGDGGMLTTASDDLAERLRLLRAHGMKPRYYHRMIGVNSRLDSIQAAVLNTKLSKLADWTEARRRNAQQYHELFAASGLSNVLTLPHSSDGVGHVWNQYTVRVHGGQRDNLRKSLADAGVATEIYYPIPLHLQECFRKLGYGKGSLPETERAASEVLSLPIFPMMTHSEQQTVVSRIVQFFERTSRRPPSSPLFPHIQAGKVATPSTPV